MMAAMNGMLSPSSGPRPEKLSSTVSKRKRTESNSDTLDNGTTHNPQNDEQPTKKLNEFLKDLFEILKRYVVALL